MKVFSFLILVFVAMVTLGSGCGTTEPYTGPAALTPIVEDVPYRHVNSIANPRQPFWETHHILVFKNPLFRPVAFEVDCKQGTTLQTSFYRVDVPARTVSRLLIVKEDGACDIKRVQ